MHLEKYAENAVVCKSSQTRAKNTQILFYKYFLFFFSDNFQMNTFIKKSSGLYEMYEVKKKILHV